MNSHKKRSINIDVIKGLGILSVILLHTFNTEYLLKIGAPFYIWQAVPVFIILQGFNLTNSYKRRDFYWPGMARPGCSRHRLRQLLLWRRCLH